MSTEERVCPVCHGEGIIPPRQPGPGQVAHATIVCWHCNGEGRMHDEIDVYEWGPVLFPFNENTWIALVNQETGS